MPINITMPALSPTMEEGTLSKWLVGPGDTIEAGDVIAEMRPTKRRWKSRRLMRAWLRKS